MSLAEIGELTLIQMESIFLTEDLPILRRIRPPVVAVEKGKESPSGKDRESLGKMPQHEIMRKVEKYRFDLFDKVCDHLKKTPKELLVMRTEDLALAFVEVTAKLGNPLPIERFEPVKLKKRVLEYVKAKGQ